jgi:hypothetical protein
MCNTASEDSTDSVEHAHIGLCKCMIQLRLLVINSSYVNTEHGKVVELYNCILEIFGSVPVSTGYIIQT